MPGTAGLNLRKTEQAQSMVPQLTGLSMTVWQKDSAPLKAFEKKYCFLPRIQTLYSVKGLLTFFDIKDGSHIYVLTDALETKAVILSLSISATRWKKKLVMPSARGKPRRLCSCGGR